MKESKIKHIMSQYHYAMEVRSLNDNKVIETWHEINLRPENRISGQ
jgi:hypothetical protein